MAEIIANQPIIFNEEPDCWLEDSGIKVLAQHGDITQFQMALEPCGSDLNVIQDGNFPNDDNWTLGTGWSIDNGKACHDVSLFSSISQTAPVSNGVLVKLVIDIETSSEGCVVQWGSFGAVINNTGVYTYYFVADGATSFGVACVGSASVCINSVQALTVNTNFAVIIVDEESNPVAQIDAPDSAFNFEDGFFTCSIDWEALSIPNGCYTIAVIDPCPCSQRGITSLDFTTGLFNWSLASSWIILGGTATYNGSSAGQAILNHVVCDEVDYIVTYTLSNMGANEEFNVRLGSANGITRTADGTYTETITSNGTSFIMVGNSTSGTQTFEVTDMVISAASSDVTAIQSNVIKVSESFDCKTLALAFCNDSNGLGFGFENTGFRPLMRIPASLNRSSYPMERLGYEYSTGRKATYYSRVRKALELGFDGKVFMHDFASLFGACDHFYIDDVEYYVEDDEYPSISWSDGDDSGGVTLQVSVKEQLVENKRLSSASVGCETGGAQLLDDNGTVITDEEDSEITTP